MALVVVGVGGAGVDGRLDGGCVVVEAIAGGAEIDD